MLIKCVKCGRYIDGPILPSVDLAAFSCASCETGAGRDDAAGDDVDAAPNGLLRSYSPSPASELRLGCVLFSAIGVTCWYLSIDMSTPWVSVVLAIAGFIFLSLAVSHLLSMLGSKPTVRVFDNGIEIKKVFVPWINVRFVEYYHSHIPGHDGSPAREHYGWRFYYKSYAKPRHLDCTDDLRQYVNAADLNSLLKRYVDVRHVE
jgi:hypothetical protein